MSDERKPSRGLLGRLRGAFGEPAEKSVSERRSSRRIELPIPVQLKVENRETRVRRLRDFSQQALCIEAALDGAAGEKAAVRFEGYEDVCGPFILSGEVLRVTEEDPPGLVIEIDRESSSDEALAQYRTLVLHYIRHKPLLEEVGKGYFEGRCDSCGWIGRVGSKKPTCSVCGGKVTPVAG